MHSHLAITECSASSSSVETALELFHRILPRRMRAGPREAMYFIYEMPKPWALRESEIAPNDDERITSLVVDVDRKPVTEPGIGGDVRVGTAATAFLDTDIPRPNLIIENPVSRHAHYVYVLADPLYLKTQGGRALRFAAAIHRALTRAIPGGGKTYAWRSATMHNPFSPRYRTIEVRHEPYRLAELAQGLDLARSLRVTEAPLCDVRGMAQGGRNNGLFWGLLWAANGLMREHRDANAYEEALVQIACDTNATFLPPMDFKEVACIAASVLRYRPFHKRDRAGELKALRHAEGRTWERVAARSASRREQAIEMRGGGMTIEAIAQALGVGERRVYAYLQASVVESVSDSPPVGQISVADSAVEFVAESAPDFSSGKLIEVIPIQGNTPTHARENDKRRKNGSGPCSHFLGDVKWKYALCRRCGRKRRDHPDAVTASFAAADLENGTMAFALAGEAQQQDANRAARFRAATSEINSMSRKTERLKTRREIMQIDDLPLAADTERATSALDALGVVVRETRAHGRQVRSLAARFASGDSTEAELVSAIQSLQSAVAAADQIVATTKTACRKNPKKRKRKISGNGANAVIVRAAVDDGIATPFDDDRITRRRWRAGDTVVADAVLAVLAAQERCFLDRAALHRDCICVLG